MGIAGLFYLNRDASVRPSKALWLPVLYLLILGSRPVSAWVGIEPAAGTDTQLDGSPIDAVFFGVLLIAALAVLIQRGERTRQFLAANWPILIYFLYCLVSVLWSDFPGIALKRWVKATGDLALALVILTDAQPIAALRRMFSRLGFLLLPTSVLFIKYYVNLGKGYTPDGEAMNTGVTTNKNTLGVVLLVVCLGTLWNFVALLRAKSGPNRGRQLFAQGVLLAFGFTLLGMADSATSLACFVLGAVLIVAMEFPFIRRQPGRVHALVAMIVLAAGLAMLFGGQAGVTHALGRQSNLTGRTEIWAAVMPVVPNRLIGAGFESFWLGPRLNKVWNRLSQYMHVNEAHNGYLEVYLNLGWVGVGLIIAILISGYQRAVKAFRQDPVFGSLMLAYVAAAFCYSLTEAGFRMLGPMWFFLLLAVAGSSRFASMVNLQGAEQDGRPPFRATTRNSSSGFNPKRGIGRANVSAPQWTPKPSRTRHRRPASPRCKAPALLIAQASALPYRS